MRIPEGILGIDLKNRFPSAKKGWLILCYPAISASPRQVSGGFLGTLLWPLFVINAVRLAGGVTCLLREKASEDRAFHISTWDFEVISLKLFFEFPRYDDFGIRKSDIEVIITDDFFPLADLPVCSQAKGHRERFGCCRTGEVCCRVATAFYGPLRFSPWHLWAYDAVVDEDGDCDVCSKDM